MSDRLPPFDNQAEAGALACVLTGRDDMIDRLVPDDFYDVRHREIFAAMRCMRIDGISVNETSVYQWLCDKGRLQEAGGLEYVSDLPDKTPTSAHFDFFLDAVKDRSARRRIIADSARVTELAFDTALPIATVFDAASRNGHAHLNGQAKKFTVRRPAEFLAMQFDESDSILGERLFAPGQSLVIAAVGGLGKSRLILQLAACAVSRRKFLALNTGGRDLKWLILQTENSNRRLKHDLQHLHQWLGDDWPRFDEQVRIHAVENDTDAFVSLDNPENVRNIESAIAEHKPDIIGIDPLNEFAIGDLNKDVDMKATLLALSRVCRRGNPNRGIVVLHHAITGKAGAAKATGYDRASFARNSKVLHGWTRGQINIAPVDPDSYDRLILACGKCSNGREFQPFGIRLNEGMIYECDPSIDVKEWENQISNNGSGPAMTHDRVAELCKPLMTKSELSKVIIEDCGCYRGSAYRYIARATGKTIRLNKANGTYSRK